MPTFAAWSQAFLGDVAEDLFTCFLEEAEWRRIHDAFAMAKRIFAVLTIQEQKFTCALGHPVRSGIDTEDETDRVFLPPWLLQAARLEGLGEHVTVEWITEEHVPEATKIVLRPHEAAFYGANAKEELEPALTRYGILQAGSTVPVPIEALDGYLILFDVIRTEPADMVLMEGDEVAIDFEAALDYQGVLDPSTPERLLSAINHDTSFHCPASRDNENLDNDLSTKRCVEPAAAAVTAPAAPVQEPEPFEEMITAAPVASTQSEGRTLGGTTRPRLPDGRAWNPYRNA